VKPASTDVLKRFRTVASLLFALLMVLLLSPSQATRIEDQPAYTLLFAILLESILILVALLSKKPQTRQVVSDVIGFVYAVLIAWVAATAKLNLLNGAVFPPPGAVIKQFADDIDKIVVNILSSLGIILQGYLLAIVLAIPLGLALGWHARIGRAATYISKFLSSISPIVYIPYAIVLLPTFRAASIFVIFIASFWPTLAGTMSGVFNVEKRIIDSARALNVGGLTMMFRIILPASLPQIFIGCNQGLSVSFVLLTSAEMIGARSGMGYYVNNYANFGNYTRALAGVLVIGLVVTGITFLFNALQRWLLKWKR
jgi:NitT/TauT family transport system permease protein